MDFHLTGMRALVTGASDGIGLEAARALRAEGAAVAIASRDPAAAAQEIGASAVMVDLSTTDGGERAVAGAVEALGGLDVLVNNVGSSRIASFEQLTEDDWQTAWDLNVMSHVRCIRSALPALKASSQAAIVNVASTSGKRPSLGMPHYSVTKAAVLSLSRLVADTYASAGIRCNAVCPGPVDTPLLRELYAKDPEQAARRLVHLPMGRFATAEEIARAALYLASEESSYMTAATFLVDGGLSGAYTTPL